MILDHNAIFCQSYFEHAFGPLQTSAVFNVSLAVRHGDGSWSMRAGIDPRLNILGLDQNGSPQWLNHYRPAEMSDLTLIYSTATAAQLGTLVVFGDTLDPVGPGLRRRKMGLTRIGANGVVDWARMYQYDVPSNIPFSADGHEIAVNEDGGFFIDGGEPTAPAVMRFTASGELIWSRTMGSQGPIGRFVDLRTDDLGGCYFLADGAISSADTSAVILGRLSESGAVLWSMHIQTLQAGRFLDPFKLLRRVNGDLVVFATNSGGGNQGTAGVLLHIGGDGDFLSADEYWCEGSSLIRIHDIHELSDGQLLLSVDCRGPGFVRLDELGDVQEAEHYAYHSIDGIWNVVEWRQTILHEDDYGVLAWYYQDMNSGPDPRTDLLMNMDAFDIDMCGTEPFEVSRNEVPTDQFTVSSGATTTSFAVMETPLTVISSPLELPSLMPFCGLYVGVEPEGGESMVVVAPTFLRAGEGISIRSDVDVAYHVTDVAGRAIDQRGSTAKEFSGTISTNGWSSGLYLIRFYAKTGSPVYLAKVMVE